MMFAADAAHTQQQVHCYLGVLFKPPGEGKFLHCLVLYTSLTYGSGSANDHELITSYTAARPTEHVHASRSCGPFTALLTIIPSHRLKTEPQKANGSSNIQVLQPDPEPRGSSEVSDPRLLLFQMDTFFLSPCSRPVTEVRKETSQVNHLALFFSVGYMEAFLFSPDGSLPALPKWGAGENEGWKLGNDLESNLLEALHQIFHCWKNHQTSQKVHCRMPTQLLRKRD